MNLGGAPAAAEWIERQWWGGMYSALPLTYGCLDLVGVAKWAQALCGGTGIQLYTSCEEPSACPATTKILEIS